METLDEAIESSIREIPSGMIFDAHTIIKLLLINHSDCYLSKMAEAENSTTNTYHGRIGGIIASKTDLAEQQEDRSYSFNIHDKLSPCSCWKRR